MSKTRILYKDVAPGADENAAVSTTAAYSASDVSLLPFGSEVIPSITLEPNRWALNGTFKYTSRQTIAFWSSELSDSNGAFINQPEITATFSQQYSSVGVTLVFDTACGEWCTDVNIKWYQGGALKQDSDFTPNAATYFCNQRVEAYDKIVITLKKSNKPRRRARLNQIIFGIYREFGMAEIRSAAITNEVSLSGLELPASSMKWELESHDDVEFMFQLKQPVEVLNNNKPIGVYYIDGSTRKGTSYYSIDCYDAFGFLSEYPFSGGVYTNKSAKALVSEIIGDDFVIEFDGVTDKNLTGIIQAGTKRDALQQVFFAWGVLAATDGGESIRVFPLRTVATEIGKDRTYTGVSVETSAIVTEVRVTAHTYAQDSEGGVEVNGVKYSDTKTVYTVKNPNVTATDKQNIIEVSNATLISTGIGQEVAQRVYDYYMKRNTLNGKIVWDGERLGDLVTMPNAWGGVNTGNIGKVEITLSNTVAASVQSLGV